ncbi:PAS domain S-box protein [uncultured Piscinibacter sp.]|uniref:PAS domain S-box protein n=1 Tax=uncultured Piscinibacter sp. TaxID=1131835 RepID=UPI002619EAE5|nr:PAS domain S-box protein [uncultured Piscinibacter sp.]
MSAAPPPIGQSSAAEFDERSVFRSLFAAYPDGLIVADGAGCIVLANEIAAELLGYTVEQLAGLSVEALVPDAIRPRHASFRNAYARAPRPRPMGTQMDLVARRRDGSEVMVEIALSPLQDHGLPYVVAAIRGIGAYPRVRQALQRAHYAEQVAQFGRLAVDARDPLQLLEQIPRVAAGALQVESAAVFLLEANRLDFRVASCVGPVPGEDAGDHVPNRPDSLPGFVLAQGLPVLVGDFAAEARFAAAQAYRRAGDASALAVPLADRGRFVGVLAVRAGTPNRFGDDELRFLDSLASLLATSLQRAQTEEALNHSQRMESVGQLTGGIAHDFNNLLTVISGNLQVLEELPSVAGDPFAQQLVGAAARASRRGAELTGKLLAFSRRQVLQPTALDAGALLQSLADMLRRTLDQRIRIEVDTPEDCPPVLADAGQLESALLNIAINARDAMPEGGLLWFACREVPPRSPDLPAELAEVEDTAYVAIAVGDTGGGMPEEVKERAFEPFFTTKDAGRGTGLGLSTVYGFAKQSKGAVRLDSMLGVGTTITLFLPSERDGAPLESEAEAVAGSVPPGLRVLLVEDDTEVRSVAQRFLAALGCTVTARANAEQAREELRPDAGIDMLVTDIALGPGMRGTELAELARQRLPTLPVLLVSGYASALLDAPPGWDVLRKPYTRAELGRAMARALAQRP